jgi:sedoheptulokinase
VLTGKKPVTHSSDAASLGFFDLKKLCFDDNALAIAGIDKSFLPNVVTATALAGRTSCNFLPQGIPVSVAIGDNQASFLGSVSQPDTSVLVNVGTGSQVSFVTNEVKPVTYGEIRPLTDSKYIYVGSSLCGGRAYAILKNFFSLCADMLGGSKENLYAKMDALSEDAFALTDELIVNCEFCGSRENPAKRGSIENIGTENFTPQALICGVLKGVASELKDMYACANHLLSFTPKHLVCSGNGLRKSRIWREIFSKAFNMSATLPTHSEEAAIGACVFAGVASGLFKNLKDAQSTLLR